MEEDSRKGAEKRKLLPVLLGLVHWLQIKRIVWLSNQGINENSQ